MRDISRLDTKLLVAFDALMEERSVTRAARRLSMTQQGMSGALQRMRTLFDDPLFVREARGVWPTPRAEALAPRVKSALASLEGVLEAEDFDPARAEGTISVATSDYAISTIMAPLFQKFRALAPKVRLAVLPFNRAILNEQLRGGQIDLALTIPQFVPLNMASQSLFEERYLAAIRADHPLAGKTIGLDAFCELEHLLVAPYMADFRGPTDTALARLDRARRVGLSIPSFAVAMSFLERTDLVAILPERVLENTNHKLYVFTPPVDVGSTEIVVVWSERVDKDPLQSWFRSLCFETTRMVAKNQ